MSNNGTETRNPFKYTSVHTKPQVASISLPAASEDDIAEITAGVRAATGEKGFAAIEEDVRVLKDGHAARLAQGRGNTQPQGEIGQAKPVRASVTKAEQNVPKEAVAGSVVDYAKLFAAEQDNKDELEAKRIEESLKKGVNKGVTRILIVSPEAHNGLTARLNEALATLNNKRFVIRGFSSQRELAVLRQMDYGADSHVINLAKSKAPDAAIIISSDIAGEKNFFEDNASVTANRNILKIHLGNEGRPKGNLDVNVIATGSKEKDFYALLQVVQGLVGSNVSQQTPTRGGR